MKKFLVIGSNSFSGSNFVNYLLKEGHQVFGTSRSEEPEEVFLPYKWSEEKILKNFKYSKFDLNNQLDQIIELSKEQEVEYVVNFAAQGMVAESWKSPQDWYQTNVVAQVKLHDNLRKLKSLKRYVHVSTPEAYGSTDSGWLKENYNFLPSTPYAVSRAACDLHLLSFYKAYDFPVIFTRAANVYGPGQQLYRIIPRTLLFSRLHKKLKLHGGGHSVRSFIHIDDVVDATLKIALEGRIGETYHISTNDTISIRDLVSKLVRLTGDNFESLVEETEDRMGKDQSYLLDSSKLRTELLWEDKIPLGEGLKETLSWLDKNIECLKTLPSDYSHKK